MKQFFHQDKALPGAIAVLAVALVAATLLWVGLRIAGLPAMEHLNWFAGIFIPAILVVRHYAKQKEYPTATKAAIITCFITFVAYMFLFFNIH